MNRRRSKLLVRCLNSLKFTYGLFYINMHDGSYQVQDSPFFRESTKFTCGDNDYVKGDYERTNEFCVPEDFELAKQMNDLGLPLSFRAKKETRCGMTSGKRKGSRKSLQQSPTEIDDCMLDSIKALQEDSRSPTSLLDTSKVQDQSDMLKIGNVAELDGLFNLSLERRDLLSSTACASTISNEHEFNDLSFVENFNCSLGHVNNMLDEAESIPSTYELMATGLREDCGTSEGRCLINDGANCDRKERDGEFDSHHLRMDHYSDAQSNDISLEVIKDADVAAYEQFSEQDNYVMINNHQIANSGEWEAYWDDFHSRTYFYNVEKQESTWDPPSGMEHYVYGNIADESTNTTAGLFELDTNQIDPRTSEEAPASPHDSIKELSRDAGSLSQQSVEIEGTWLSADYAPSINTKSKKKKVRRSKSNRMLFISTEDPEGVLYEVTPSISKYWCQRYLLFSRYEYGIKMDEEGWFSVTPEPIAKHHSARCGNGAIVDFFAGVGGNAIQFAQRSKHVIAIDIDPIKIAFARHNAAIYGVNDRIDFMKGDSFSLASKLKADTVFMSPSTLGGSYLFQSKEI